MSQDWTVLSVSEPRPWKGKGNSSFVDFVLDISDGQNTESNVTLCQKPESPDPQPNQIIYGHIEEKPIPKKDGTTFTKRKLKKDQREGEPRRFDGSHVTGPRRDRQSPGNAGQGADTRQHSYDDRQERIEWQSARRDAISMLAGQNPSLETVIELARKLYQSSPPDAGSVPPGVTDDGERGAVGPSSSHAPAASPPVKAATGPQKAKLTRLIHEKGGSDLLRDNLRTWATEDGVLSSRRFSEAIDAIQNAPDAVAGCRGLGVPIPSTLPEPDLSGIPFVDDEVGNGDDDPLSDLPF